MEISTMCNATDSRAKEHIHIQENAHSGLIVTQHWTDMTNKGLNADRYDFFN